MKIKVCIMAAFLSVLLFFSNIPVKAANDVAFPAFPEPIEGISSTHYLISYNPENDSYCLYQPLDPQDVYIENQYGNPVMKFRESVISYYWLAGEGAKSWEESAVYYTGNSLVIHNGFLYSSFDLFYSDGELFFQKAPIKASFLTQMKKVEMGATLTTLVSLMPLLIGLVVCFLAFRKALAWLLKILHKA